jgi:hypothetical protein
MVFTATERATLAEALAQVETRAGTITPDAVVHAAEVPTNPLHGYFEWDDSKAGHAYRVDQARNLIRSVKVQVTVEDRVLSTVCYVRDPSVPGDEQGYITIKRLRLGGHGSVVHGSVWQGLGKAVERDLIAALHGVAFDAATPTAWQALAVEAANALETQSGALLCWAEVVAHLLGARREEAPMASMMAAKYGQVLRVLAGLAPEKTVTDLMDGADEILAIFARRPSRAAAPAKARRPAATAAAAQSDETAANGRR